MRNVGLAVLVALVEATTSSVFSQAAPQSSSPGPTFDVVSVKLVTEARPLGQSLTQRPDGGITMTNIPVATIISRAYPSAIPGAMVGLPEWARRDGYDVSATSTLPNPTSDQRSAMLRAMLADRFKLVVHIESREQPVFDLVLARRDGRLGSGMTSVDIDCAQIGAERNASPPQSPPQSPDFKLPPPPCTLRTVTAFIRDRTGDKQGQLGDLLEGDTTMANLAPALRLAAGRVVVDKTGLRGIYRLRMNYDSGFTRRGGGPDLAPALDAPPAVFTAVQEQLGLKLESSTASQDTLIIDRLERPSEN